ncbi:hypothetical protein SOASR029_21080 [Budvicia aquatica]|nr:hypothetical protein SOASR029_21080 [Budvicia aquatica]
MKNHFSSNNTVILRIDMHLDIHVRALINQAGKRLDTKIIQPNQDRYQELFDRE